MSWTNLVVMTCTFIAVSGVTFLAFHGIWSADKRVTARLKDLPQGRGNPSAGRRRQETGKSPKGRSRLLSVATRLIPDDQRERTRLQTRLMQAGVYSPWALDIFLSIKFVMIALPPIVSLFLAEAGLFDPYRALLYGGFAGIFGILLPSLWLQRRKSRRQMVLCGSLPDFLDLMVTCVQSGLSLEAALQRVTDELALAHPLLASEMSIVQRQIELGATPELALRNFAERSDLSSLCSLSTLIEQARRFGTSIVDALRTQAELLRYQREQRAEELAQKASVKILFPMLLFVFPTIFVVLAGPAAIMLYEQFTSEPPSAARSK